MIDSVSLHAAHLSIFATYLLHSTVAIASIWIFVVLLRPASHLLRERLWKVSLLAGVVSTLLLTVFSGQAIRIEIPRSASARLDDSPLQEVAFTNDFVEPVYPASENTVPTSEIDAVSQTVQSDSNIAITPAPSSVSNVDVVIRTISIGLCVWYCVALLRIVVATWRLSRSLSRAMEITSGPAYCALNDLVDDHEFRRPIRLLSSVDFAEPAACGLLRPAIVIPPDCLTCLTAEQTRALVAHELAHILRRDLLWSRIGLMIQSIFVFQLLNRFAVRRWMESAECQCDDWATARGVSRLTLAACLTQLAQWKLDRRQNGNLAMGATSRRLIDRVERLLSERPGNDVQAVKRSRLKLFVAATVTGLLLWQIPQVVVSAATVAKTQATPTELTIEIGSNDSVTFDDLVKELGALRRDLNYVNQLVSQMPDHGHVRELAKQMETRADALVQRLETFSEKGVPDDH